MSRSFGTLTLDLVARTGMFEQGMDRAARKSERAMKDIRESATSAASAVGRIVGALGGAFAFTGLVRMADEWGQINARLRLATESTQELALAQRRLLEIANRTYRSYSEAADQFASSSRSLREFGIATSDALDASEALSLALTAGASGAQQSAAAMNAFNRAAAQGVIDTRQLNTILTQTPRVAQALAEGLDTTTAGLVEMARSGELLMTRVIPGMNTQLNKLRGEVQSMPATVADAMQRVSNELLRFVGIANEGAGATQVLVRMLEQVADNFRTIATVVTLAGAALAGPYLGRFAANVTAVTAAQVIWLRTTIANTAALRATTVASIAATAALARLRVTLLTLVGGPWGIALMATAGLFLAIRANARQAREELDAYRAALEELSRADLLSAIVTVDEQLTEARERLRRAVDAGATPLFGRLQREVDGLQARFDALNQRYAEMRRQAQAALPTADELDTAEVERLANLIRLQGASNAEWERARQIIRQTNAELEQLTGTDIASQQQRIALLERRRTLEQAMSRGGGTTPLESLQRESEAAVRRLEAARQYRASTDDIAQLTQRVLAAEREVTAEIERRGGILHAEVSLLQEALRLRQATALPELQLPRVELAPLTVIPRIELGPIEGLDRVMQAVRDAQAELDLARLSPSVDAEGLRVAEERLREVREAAEETLGAVADFLSGLNLPAPVIAGMLDRIREALEGTGIEFDKAARSGSSFVRVMSTMTRGALNVTRSLSGINRELADTLSATVDLLDAWDQLQEVRANAAESGKTDILGMISGVMGTIGAVVALGSALGSIIGGESTYQKAQREAVERNSQALRGLRASMDGFRNSLGQISAIVETLDAGLAQQLGSIVSGERYSLGPLGITSRGLQAFIGALNDAGLSLADLRRIAEANGIQLLDDNGRLVASAFADLAEILNLTRERALSLGDSFADVQRQQNAFNRIFQIEDTPIQRLNDSIALLGNFASPLGDMFAAIDLTSTEGQALARDLLQRIYRSAEAGMDGEFGAIIAASGFENINELMDSILGISDSLDAMNEATREATAGMLNVPTGFRIALRRFESTAAEVGPAISPVAAAGRTDYFGRADTLPQSVEALRLQQDSYTFTAPILIDARERDAGELFDDIKTEAQRRSRAIGGALAPATTAFEQ